MAHKFHLTKKQVVAGIVTIVVIAAAAGFGILVRMLQQSGINGKNPSASQDEGGYIAAKLPPLITEVQNLQSSGKTDEAKKKIDEALDNSATDNNTKYMLYIQKGNVLTNNGDVQGGIAQYLKAFEVSQTYEVTRLLGESYQQVGDKPKAVEFYKKALALVPENGPLTEQDRESIRKIITSLGGTV